MNLEQTSYTFSNIVNEDIFDHKSLIETIDCLENNNNPKDCYFINGWEKKSLSNIYNKHKKLLQEGYTLKEITNRRIPDYKGSSIDNTNDFACLKPFSLMHYENQDKLTRWIIVNNNTKNIEKGGLGRLIRERESNTKYYAQIKAGDITSQNHPEYKKENIYNYCKNLNKHECIMIRKGFDIIHHLENQISKNLIGYNKKYADKYNPIHHDKEYFKNIVEDNILVYDDKTMRPLVEEVIYKYIDKVLNKDHELHRNLPSLTIYDINSNQQKEKLLKLIIDNDNVKQFNKSFLQSPKGIAQKVYNFVKENGIKDINALTASLLKPLAAINGNKNLTEKQKSALQEKYIATRMGNDANYRNDARTISEIKQDSHIAQLTDEDIKNAESWTALINGTRKVIKEEEFRFMREKNAIVDDNELCI